MLMNSRMMIGIGIGMVLVALVVGVVIYLNYQKVDPNKGPVVAKGDIIYLNNGFTGKERQDFYHMAEGSELYPVLWMQALKTKESKYFLDDVERLGFLLDPENDHGLPVGLTSGVTRGLEPLGPMSGLNCAACHVGELHYKGKRVRIDGAPNLLNTREFFVTLIDSALDTAKDPDKLIAFIAKVHELEEKTDKKESSKIRALARKVAVGLDKKEEEALNAALKPLFDDLIK